MESQTKKTMKKFLHYSINKNDHRRTHLISRILDRRFDKISKDLFGDDFNLKGLQYNVFGLYSLSDLLEKYDHKISPEDSRPRETKRNKQIKDILDKYRNVFANLEDE
jgi:hypothetical protein